MSTETKFLSVKTDGRIRIYGVIKELSDGRFLVRNYIEGAGIKFQMFSAKGIDYVKDNHPKTKPNQIVTQEELEIWKEVLALCF